MALSFSNLKSVYGVSTFPDHRSFERPNQPPQTIRRETFQGAPVPVQVPVPAQVPVPVQVPEEIMPVKQVLATEPEPRPARIQLWNKRKLLVSKEVYALIAHVLFGIFVLLFVDIIARLAMAGCRLVTSAAP